MRGPSGSPLPMGSHLCSHPSQKAPPRDLTPLCAPTCPRARPQGTLQGGHTMALSRLVGRLSPAWASVSPATMTWSGGCKDSRAAPPHPTPLPPPRVSQPQEALPGRPGSPACPTPPEAFLCGSGAWVPPGNTMSGGEITLQLPVCWGQAPGPSPAPRAPRPPAGAGWGQGLLSRSQVSTPDPVLPTQGCREVPQRAPDCPGAVGLGALRQQDSSPRSTGGGGDWGWDRGGNEATALLGPLPQISGKCQVS